MIVGSPSLRGHTFTLGHNATPMKYNNTLLERKAKNLAIEFNVSGAHDRVVGCQCDIYLLVFLICGKVVLFASFGLQLSRPQMSLTLYEIDDKGPFMYYM